MSELKLMKGNEALAEAAIRAGYSKKTAQIRQSYSFIVNNSISKVQTVYTKITNFLT